MHRRLLWLAFAVTALAAAGCESDEFFFTDPPARPAAQAYRPLPPPRRLPSASIAAPAVRPPPAPARDPARQPASSTSKRKR